jgi:hypothetical protein
MLKLLSFTFLFSLPLYGKVEIPKENKNLFKCLKRLGSSNRLDSNLMLSTVNSLSDIKSPSDIPRAVEICRENVKQLKKNKRVKRDLVVGRYRQLGVNIGHPRRPYFLFQEFINITTDCRLYGAKIIASAGVGVGVGTGVGKCQSTNGRTWLVSSVTFGAYIGLAAVAGVIEQEVDLWHGQGSVETDLSITHLYGAGTGTSDNHDEFYAAGLAVRTWGLEADILLKLIPTGNNFEELNQKLLRLYQVNEY